MSQLPFKRDHGATEISLEEDVYVVIGDSGQSSTTLSAWPAAGSYGPVPEDGIVGRPEEVLDSIGPELWKAKRQDHTVCLVERCERYGPATALLWAADCVEHCAKRIYGVDGNVIEALALARHYATEHVYNPEQAHPLTAEIEKLLKGLRRGGLGALAKGSDSRAVALLHAAKGLCGADPLLSAREAAHWCREAAGRNSGEPETTWQAQELLKYLEPPAADQAQAS